MTKGGKLTEGLFAGETINTPSMLAVEDALDGLRWAERIGGLPALIGRVEGQSGGDRTLGGGNALGRLPRRRTKRIRSRTSVCLKMVDPRFAALAAPTAALPSPSDSASSVEAGGRRLRHRLLPRRAAGLRLWAGATVETADLEALFPWLDWAWASRRRPNSPPPE